MKVLTIIYDNWCPNCSRFVQWVRCLDWFHLVTAVKLRAINRDEFNNLNLSLAKKQMASFNYQKWHYGYISLYNVFIRLPILWLFVPVFWLLKISGLGQILYKELAINRKIIPLHCDNE